MMAGSIWIAEHSSLKKYLRYDQHCICGVSQFILKVPVPRSADGPIPGTIADVEKQACLCFGSSFAAGAY